MSKETVLVEDKILNDFKKLSSRRKKEAADFIAFLKIKEELEATKEIISDKDFMDSIMKADEDFEKGRFKKWSEVIEDV
ncbi:MAG: hypothetical protein HN757_15300 [Calditrichaeota bacterium]|jgi:hypothetical protein|nr:hypothetical protein [Calditrichota bacterium]